MDYIEENCIRSVQHCDKGIGRGTTQTGDDAASGILCQSSEGTGCRQAEELGEERDGGVEGE